MRDRGRMVRWNIVLVVEGEKEVVKEGAGWLILVGNLCLEDGAGGTYLNFWQALDHCGTGDCVDLGTRNRGSDGGLKVSQCRLTAKSKLVRPEHTSTDFGPGSWEHWARESMRGFPTGLRCVEDIVRVLLGCRDKRENESLLPESLRDDAY